MFYCKRDHNLLWYETWRHSLWRLTRVHPSCGSGVLAAHTLANRLIQCLWLAVIVQELCESRGGAVLGPYAWVPGRRATSKVTATSGGRLTNRYAWVPGRPTRRAFLGVSLPLRVPPCKHYPEKVTELKMAALILLRYCQRRLLRRNRIFRDRTNPLHKFNDLELFWQFRFRRADILQMTNELKEELEHLNRKGALPPVFTGRRTALNPCQQWTSIARQTVCPGRLQFPIFCFVCFFLLLLFFFFFFFFFFVFYLIFYIFFPSLKKSFLLRCVRSNARLSLWKAESSHLHSARPLFFFLLFFFFWPCGQKRLNYLTRMRIGVPSSKNNRQLVTCRPFRDSCMRTKPNSYRHGSYRLGRVYLQGSKTLFHAYGPWAVRPNGPSGFHGRNWITEPCSRIGLSLSLICQPTSEDLKHHFIIVVGGLGPYAWVPGRRATSKVTATSGGRLTNRYAWVPGRPTRRACLGVSLPLRVPPCKHYPEEVTELKMAALILLRYRQRRLLRRNRIFRDRTNPLHKFNDLELFWQFRFRRADILQMTNELKEELEHLNRKGALPPVFTGRRTALNPCQQWTSIARQTVCPGRLQFPIFCFVCFFLLLFFFFFLFFVFYLIFYIFFPSLKKSFLLRCVRSNARLSLWKAESSHLHSARPLFFFFFFFFLAVRAKKTELSDAHAYRSSII